MTKRYEASWHSDDGAWGEIGAYLTIEEARSAALDAAAENARCLAVTCTATVRKLGDDADEDGEPWFHDVEAPEGEETEDVHDLRERVERAAVEHGWDVELAGAAETGTRYLDLSRGEQTIRVRLGDHPTAYCREDISLVTNGAGGGDDHTFQALERRLR